MPLSTFDLLFASDDEQQIIACLTRKPQLTVAEIADATLLSVSQVAELIERLVGEAKLVEQYRDGRRVLSVRYTRNASARIRNLPPELLAGLEISHDEFLRRVPISQELTPDEQATLLSKSSTRLFLPEEILAWQGKTVEQVGVVQQGLARRERLQGRGASAHIKDHSQSVGYVRQGDWFGLVEMLTNPISVATFTAVVETQVLFWSIRDFLAFVSSMPNLAVALNRVLAQELREAQTAQTSGSKLWVVKSAQPGDGATMLSGNLAALSALATDNSGSKTSRTVLWSVNRDSRALVAQLGLDRHSAQPSYWQGAEPWFKHKSGFDVLVQPQTDYTSYPPAVQLDIMLNQLQAHFDVVVCDTGSETDSDRTSDDFVRSLRGLADVVLTITRNQNALDKAKGAGDSQKTVSRPGQKNILILNFVDPAAQPIPTQFHLALPADAACMHDANKAGLPVVQFAPDAPLSQMIQELQRRLSLTHSIAVFVPSTLDVDVMFDNTHQVKSAIHFFGGLFGGAVSNQADGVWKSEDKGLVTEQVTIVRAFVSQQLLDTHLNSVIDYAGQLKAEMQQEAIALDVDGQLVLV